MAVERVGWTGKDQAQAAEPVSVVRRTWHGMGLEQVGAWIRGWSSGGGGRGAFVDETTTEYATIMKLATERTNRDHLESARFGATMEYEMATPDKVDSFVFGFRCASSVAVE